MIFRFVPWTALIVVLVSGGGVALAQTATRLEFDVISIKRHTDVAAGGGMRNLPDGTFIMTNQPIRSTILGASPVPSREVIGIPDWVNTERYDMTTKPPAGSTREQQSQMLRALFADRMKLAAHVEQRERTTFALVLARADGRLGPQLTRSTLDCSPRSPGSAPTAPPPPPSDFRNRCGMAFGPTSIVSGGITMDQLVLSLAGLAGGLVNNRTGLEGSYALSLTFSQPRTTGATPNAGSPDDSPEIFTALQEQLGLKLRPEKTMVPVFVVDHIERPSDD